MTAVAGSVDRRTRIVDLVVFLVGVPFVIVWVIAGLLFTLAIPVAAVLIVVGSPDLSPGERLAVLAWVGAVAAGSWISLYSLAAPYASRPRVDNRLALTGPLLFGAAFLAPLILSGSTDHGDLAALGMLSFGFGALRAARENLLPPRPVPLASDDPPIL